MKTLLTSRPFSPLSQVPTKRTNPFVEDIADALRPLQCLPQTDLNATPSKCAGDRTPDEVFRGEVTVEGYRTEKLSYRQKSQKS